MLKELIKLFISTNGRNPNKLELLQLTDLDAVVRRCQAEGVEAVAIQFLHISTVS